MTQIFDAVTILERRVPEDPELREMIAEEERKLAIAQLVYDARIEAGLTQKQLADCIGTRQPVIARLENANYGAQSLAMLYRIAKAVGKQVQVALVNTKDKQEQKDKQQAFFDPEQVKQNWTDAPTKNSIFRLETGFSPKPTPGYKPGAGYSNAA